MNYGLVVAAGKSGALGSKVDRAFLSLGPKPILAYTLLAFEQCDDIDGVVLVVRKERVDAARSLLQLFGCNKVIKVVAGGTLRTASVLNGLAEIPDEAKFVTIHEASRPLVTPKMISDTLAASKRGGAASVALKITDPVVNSDRGTTSKSAADASKFWALQSPQSFKTDLLKRALENLAPKEGLPDEAAAVAKLGEPVRLVPGSPDNIKILTSDDLPMAAILLKL
ncbi:MAG: 2-C-methyl-D-erythritol 4-phosphate cytidylyltransferase [Verrucomicrobia bacterium]|jgi:2-C-methyl-D-erythritol 4-phosphate cytidylyltransferase|nr:2-C-methyl-D-erythritol 4-phosphate cytidylyltransferase [Verrucomicrobiota bacterium]